MCLKRHELSLRTWDLTNDLMCVIRVSEEEQEDGEADKVFGEIWLKASQIWKYM